MVLHRRYYNVLPFVIMSLAAITVCLFISPGRAATLPAIHDGWLNFKGSQSPASATVNIENVDANEVDLSAQIPGLNIETITLAGKQYVRFYGDNMGVGAVPGLPDLPVLRRLVEVPLGAEYSLELIRARVNKTSLSYLGIKTTIAPLQPPNCKCDDRPPPFTINETAYLNNSLYPAQPIVIAGEHTQRGHRILTVEIWPLAYNPISGMLELYSQVDFRIHLSGSDMAFTDQQADRFASPAFEASLSRQVLNFNQGKNPHQFSQDDPIGYLVISADAYYSSMAPFVALKEQEGFTVTHTPLSAIGSTSEAIKAYIQNAYDTWTLPPSYVLLVGDTDTLPTWTGLVTGTSTDLYFVTMDGPSDWHPDLGHGRFPVRSIAQVNAMVNKYLAFAALDGTEPWVKKAGFPATCDQYLVAEGTHNYVINNYMIDHGFSGTFPEDPQPGGDKLFCVTNNATQADVQASLDNGRGIFIYSGHGSYTGWELYNQSSIPTITPGYYPFVASYACLTGDFDQPEVFGETWVLQENKGALAYWGSSTYSYWDEDDTLERAMFDSLFTEGVSQPDYTGMTYDGLSVVELTYPSSAQYYWETYNILGDPAASILLEPRKPDLTMSVDPDPVEICSSGIVSTTVSAESRRGVGMTLDFTAINLPQGVGATFVPTFLVLPGESTLNLTIPETTTTGVYALGIQGIIPHEVTKTITLTLAIYNDIPGVPDLQSPASEATNVPVRPIFIWSSSQIHAYDIQIATDRQFTQVVDHSEGLTDASYIPAKDLAYNTVYYWRVSANNACGDSVFSPAKRFLTEPTFGQCSQGTQEIVLLSENFDGEVSGWTHGGLGDTWSPSTIRKHSGSFAYKAEDRPDISDQWMVSPATALSGPGPFTLSFWNYRYLQSRSGGCYDGGILEVSIDGGSSWIQLDDQIVSDPYDGPIAPDTGNPLAGKDAWCIKQSTWLNSLIDLDVYAGQAILLKFRLGTDATTGYEGWYIDDVLVRTCKISAAFNSPSNIKIAAGSVATHTLTLVNNGPADTFNLSLSDNTWPTQIIGSEGITVPQGGMGIIQVRVNPPAAVAASDTFTLKAVSGNIPGISFSVTGTTTTYVPVVETKKINLPLLKK